LPLSPSLEVRLSRGRRLSFKPAPLPRRLEAMCFASSLYRRKAGLEPAGTQGHIRLEVGQVRH
jgi:hypothetical protein